MERNAWAWAQWQGWAPVWGGASPEPFFCTQGNCRGPSSRRTSLPAVRPPASRSARHYASHLGIDLALVGAAFFIVRMIDIPVDGLLGWTMDKTRTRWGRYRLWTILGAPVLMAGIYFLFMPPAAARSSASSASRPRGQVAK